MVDLCGVLAERLREAPAKRLYEVPAKRQCEVPAERQCKALAERLCQLLPKRPCERQESGLLRQLRCRWAGVTGAPLLR